MTRLYPRSLNPDGLERWIPGGTLGKANRSQLAERLERALVAPVRELLDAGGQRWRSDIAAQTVALLGGDVARFMPILAALEIAHTGSLIVDDVEDQSTLRRGRPAAHTVHGIPTALNAGTNAYFTMNVALRHCLPDDALLRGQVSEVYLDALRAAHAGQALDILGHREEMERAVALGDASGLLEAIRLTHRLKTGAVTGAGFDMTALFTGAGRGLRSAFTDFGSALGTAYQIADDVADLRGVTRKGKATKRAAEDLHNGKITMPLAHAVRLLPAPRLRAMWATLRTGTASRHEIERARQSIQECGAMEACEAEARVLLEDAWIRLRPLLPDSPATEQFYKNACGYVERHLAS